MKENVYDDPRFFQAYGQMERSREGLAAAGEWYALEKLLPRFTDRRVLDLGCGYGWHCRYAAAHGARGVVGVDLSARMIARAREMTDDPRITYRQAAIEDFGADEAAYDIVLSSLALHYVADITQICRAVFAWLAPGGTFVFSVEHPVFTAQGPQQWVEDEQGHAMFWPVDRYFDEGPRKSQFLGIAVTKYHRTMETYLRALWDSGLSVRALVEPRPDPALLARHPEYADELRRPMFTIFAADKR